MTTVYWRDFCHPVHRSRLSSQGRCCKGEDVEKGLSDLSVKFNKYNMLYRQLFAISLVEDGTLKYFD